MSTNIVFLDASLDTINTLLATISPHMDVCLLDSQTDALEQMAAYLVGRQGVDSIHILSHGSAGELQLGGQRYNRAALEAAASSLQTIGQTLAAKGDILLYGCDVGLGESGQAFLETLATLTGADVAASTNLTGLGGDWILETFIGPVETSPVSLPQADVTLSIGLDTGFSTDGKVTTDFGGTDYGRSMAVQTDGKILVAGFSGTSFMDQDFAVARYNSDGSLDTSFSGDGKLTTDFGWSTHGEAVAVQNDGKIVVAGGSINNSYAFDFALARYNADGSLDTSFSGDGKLTTDLGDDDTAYAMAIQNDGKILVAGETVPGVGVVRYNSNGTLDTSFAGDGKFTYGAPNGGCIASAMTLQNDGKILIAGYSNHVVNFTQTVFDFMVMRLTATGELDTSFGSGGVVVTDMGTDFDEAGGVVVQGDGKILVSGHTSSGYGLARYNTNGSLDTSFGGDGIVTTELDVDATGFAVALQADGKILVSGTTDAGLTVARYNSNGSLDATFDGDGLFNIDFGGLGTVGCSIKALSGGVILVAGTSWASTTNTDFALARLVDSAATNLNLTGTNGPDTLNGGTGNDTLNGLGGDDTLNGGAGADTMVGGTGNDIYVVDNAGDSTSETSALATEIDTVLSSVSWTLGANIEKLTLTGTGAINSTGNSLNNTLVGNSGANVLNGGAGIDTMIGGLGNDTYYVDNAGDVSSETSTLATEIDTVLSSVTRTLGANIEKLTLIGTGAINGTGNSLNNTLVGNSGANVLNGGAGIDTMTGGLGNDTYYVDNAGDVTSEMSGLVTEIDTVLSSVTRTLGANIEKLTLIGTGAINGSGNSLNNTLVGNSGANVLNGGAGIDAMTGGLGNDTYYVDNANDFTTETSTLVTEIDTVLSSVTRTLGANIERLTLIGTAAINGTGNGLNNTVVGNTAANVLSGGAGNDILNGGSGNDVLFGGLGIDSLIGGAGVDFFVFDTALNATTNRDTITDFVAVDDTIRLDQTVFTKLTTTGMLSSSVFHASATGAAADSNDYILYNTATGALLYDLDGNGTGTAVHFASLSTKPTITAADFVVIA
jgi:uncharacterized delta-60 repeat protein